MALIKCPECGKEISDKAKACIHCGCPMNIVIQANHKIEEKTVVNSQPEKKSIFTDESRLDEYSKIGYEVDRKAIATDKKKRFKLKKGYLKTNVRFNGGKFDLRKAIFVGVASFCLILVLAYKPVMYANAMNKFESGEYKRAAEIFNGMLDYSDSEKCYEECQKYICADYAFLEDLEIALYNRMKYPDNQEQITNTELEKLKKYETETFYDRRLKQYAKNYINGLRIQSGALEMDFIDRKIRWTTGKVTRFIAIEMLYSNYDLCKDQYPFELAYLGQADNAKKELEALKGIKTDLNEQLAKIKSVSIQNKKALVPLKNNTEYEYDLLLYLDYYDSSDNKIDEGYQIIVDVTSGKKINGKVPCPSSWDTCWIHFDVDNLEF